MNEEVIDRLENFFSQYKLINYQKGDSIIESEDDPKGVYFLKQGYARLYSISPDGQELTLNIFKPGSYFSMMWALADLPNRYFFQAMTNIKVYLAPKKKVVEFLKKEPEILFELTKRILTGLEGTLNTMENLLFGKANNKIASVLLTLVKRFGKKQKNGDWRITLSLTHQDIANLAGLTRETTSLEIKKLVKEKIIINQRRQIIIKNSARLEKETEIKISSENPSETY